MRFRYTISCLFPRVFSVKSHVQDAPGLLHCIHRHLLHLQCSFDWIVLINLNPFSSNLIICVLCNIFDAMYYNGSALPTRNNIMDIFCKIFAIFYFIYLFLKAFGTKYLFSTCSNTTVLICIYIIKYNTMYIYIYICSSDVNHKPTRVLSLYSRKIYRNQSSFSGQNL